jgi:hypothetical protein
VGGDLDDGVFSLVSMRCVTVPNFNKLHVRDLHTVSYSKVIRSLKEEKATKVDPAGPIGSDHYNNK